MINKIYGKYIILCDICEDDGEAEDIKKLYDTFDKAVWATKENGWETKLEDGVWLNICPDCQE